MALQAHSSSTTKDVTPKLSTDVVTDIYLRVHLPNDSTTVIMVKSDMTLWEILNVISVKKELSPSQHSLVIVFSDGREEPAAPEKALTAYQNVERVRVVKDTPHPTGKGKGAASITPKVTVVTAPRQTNIRISAQEFPKTVTDQASLTTRIAAMQKSGEYQSSSKSKGVKSLSMMLFKRTPSEAAESGNTLERAGSLAPSESTGSLGSLEDSNSILSMSVGEGDDTTSTTDRKESMSSLFSVPEHVSALPNSNINLGSHSTQRQDSITSLSSPITPISGVSTPVAGSFRSRTTSAASEQQTDRDSLKDDEKLRRRTVSNPTTNAIGSALRRTNIKSRPRSNTDAITVVDAKKGLTPPAADEDKFTIVHITLPNFRSITIRAPLEVPMDAVLDNICEKNSLDFETYTFRLNDSKITTVEMDKELSYYAKEMKISEFFVVPGEKSYRTRYISEGDKDVMILQMVQGRLLVMAGTSEKLLDYLTDENEADDAYVDTFLLTFRSFTTANDCFQHLVDKYHCILPPDPSKEDIDFFNKMKLPTQKRVVSVLTWWVEHHWHDFGLSSDLRNSLEAFAEGVSFDEAFEKEGSALMSKIERQAKRYEEMYSYYKTVERRGKNLESMFMELTPEDISQQLCVLNFKLFRNIHPIEFLHQIWGKSEDGTPYLNFFIERFDKESYWVATEIVTQKDPKKRAHALRTFILTAKLCFDYNNFFSMFSIMAGLSLSPVSRLKKTWEAQPDKVKSILTDLEKMIDPSRNMKNYRDALLAAAPPIVPFLPIYLKDLTFINDGNQSNVNGMINFDKLRMMGSRVKDITSLAHTNYKFDPKPPVQNYLAKPFVEKSMSKLKELSIECEK
ncbi:hypothetical protein HDU76_000037 [Blyttiomyces sp. JEL0837]|nr:hypothetical protein HDU76_000037 [Blyttiomyces sp. JEL0837]